MIQSSIESLKSTSCHTYGMRSCLAPQTSNSNKSLTSTSGSLCHLPTSQGKWATGGTHSSISHTVHREVRADLYQAIKKEAHTGTRWHNICHIPYRFHTFHTPTRLNHLPCYLHGTPSATSCNTGAIYSLYNFSKCCRVPCL